MLSDAPNASTAEVVLSDAPNASTAEVVLSDGPKRWLVGCEVWR